VSLAKDRKALMIHNRQKLWLVSVCVLVSLFFGGLGYAETLILEGLYSGTYDTRSTSGGYTWDDILDYDFVFKVQGQKQPKANR
jgi:hypothetical protein